MQRLAVIGLLAAAILVGVYAVITLYDTHLPAGRMWETPAVKPYETAMLPMETGLVPVHGGEARFRTAATEDLISPLAPAELQIAAKGGEKLYAYYCIHCHGRDHDGGGTVGQSFAPLPGDLRTAAVQSRPDGQLFKEISYGIPDGRQPALATTISVAERWRIIAYLKSLGSRN